MMKKTALLLLALLACFAPVSGQNTILEKINAIKAQNNDYFWNEYTHPNPDTALVNATKRVLLEVNLNRSVPLSIENITPVTRSIKMNRGTLTRAFVYIRKADLDGGPIAPSSDDAAQAVAPVVPSRPFVPDMFVQKIADLKDFFKVYDFLKEQKAQRQIFQFGPLKDVEEYSSLELIIFDMQSKEVLTILSPTVNGSTRTNLMTGAEDSLDNYPEDMVLVIWYIK